MDSVELCAADSQLKDSSCNEDPQLKESTKVLVKNNCNKQLRSSDSEERDGSQEYVYLYANNTGEPNDTRKSNDTAADDTTEKNESGTDKTDPEDTRTTSTSKSVRPEDIHLEPCSNNNNKSGESITMNTDKDISCDSSDKQNPEDVNTTATEICEHGGARPKLQIQPRRVQYQKHVLLQENKDENGLSELEAYLKDRELHGLRRHSKDSDTGQLSHSDLRHKRRSLPFVPRTSQYERHALLQEKTESGPNQLEIFLMEKDRDAAEKRAKFRKGYSLQEDALLRSPQPTPLKLVPRGATSERHHLLKKTASGLSELEMLLLDKEREIEERRRGSEPDTSVGKLLPRTAQYEKNILLETLTCDGGILLDEVLSETQHTQADVLLGPTSTLSQKRSSGGSVRRVHFDPSSVCEESDGEQKDESDRLLDHPSTDSSGSNSSSATKRKKSGTGRNKLSTGLSLDKSSDIQLQQNCNLVKPEERTSKTCCVVS